MMIMAVKRFVHEIMAGKFVSDDNVAGRWQARQGTNHGSALRWAGDLMLDSRLTWHYGLPTLEGQFRKWWVVGTTWERGTCTGV